MTDPGDTKVPKTREIKAGFVRLLSSQIRAISDNPRQIREVVYELARIKLLEQLTHADPRESRELQQMLESAVPEVEHSFESKAAEPASAPLDVVPATDSPPPPVKTPPPPPIPTVAPASPPVPKATETPRPAIGPPLAQPKRSGAFNSRLRLAAILVVIAGA